MADAFTSETYNALCRDAEGYLARGLAEQARELLLKATSLIGTRSRARSLLADACMQLTLWDEAKAQLEALATLEVDNVFTHFRLGQVLEETGEYELARDNFQVVLDMNPDHHGAKVSLSRLDKISEMSSPSEAKGGLSEGQQVFADSAVGDEVFARDSSEGIDELLNTIGMGDKKEVPGVDDLLDSIGMSRDEEKKQEKPAVDFASIFGGSSEGETVPGGENPLSGVFNSDTADETTTETTDPGTMFGGDSSSEPDDPAESEEAATSDSSDVDLSAVFGSSETETAEPPAEQKSPLGTSVGVEGIFGTAAQSQEPVVVEEESEATPSVDLNSVFGAADSETQEQETVSVEEPPAVVEEEEETGQEDTVETAPSEVAEQLSDSSANLDDIFSGEEQSEETVPVEEPPAVVEEQSQNEGIVPEETGEQEIQSNDETDSTETETSSMAADRAADLNAMFSGDSTEEESEEGKEADLPDETAASHEETEAREESVEENAEEPPAEIVVEVPVVPESQEQESEEKPEVEQIKQSVSEGGEARYTLLPGNDSALCVLKLDTGSVRVIRGLVVAMDGSLSLDGVILSGRGMAWMGQGNLSPVVVKYTEGMTVRIDRVAVRSDGLLRETCGIGSVPSLCTLSGKGDNILLFVSGRVKKLPVSQGLRVRGGSVVAADPGVVFEEVDSEFLCVSGEGMLTVTA